MNVSCPRKGRPRLSFSAEDKFISVNILRNHQQHLILNPTSVQKLYLCEMQEKWTDGICMCGSHREEWRRCECVGVLCCWHCCDLFRIQDTLSQHPAATCYPIWFAFLWPLSVFQQYSDSKHNSSLCKGYLTKKESDRVLHQGTWPPQSPDLNPADMRRVGPLQVTTSWNWFN